MYSVLVDALTFSGLICLFLGILVVFLVFIRGMRPPADESNRIAHLILVWEALKSPHRFVEAKNDAGDVMFPYLTQDLGEFVRGKEHKEK